MTGVVISNYSVSGGQGDLPYESISVSYSSVQYTYQPTNPDTGAGEGNQPIKHDLETREIS